MPPDYLIRTTIKPPAAETVAIHQIGEGPETIPITPRAKPSISERLVRAKNEAAAMKHVVADTITIERVTIDDAMRLAKDGVAIETAAE